MTGLESDQAISATVAWRLLRSWRFGDSTVELGSRVIRASFQTLATDGIGELLQAVERQTGKSKRTLRLRAEGQVSTAQVTSDVLQLMNSMRLSSGTGSKTPARAK